MKISWGYKIAATYLLFVAGIMFLVFKASNEQYDLVVEDYYEQELKYQEVIDQKQRLAALSTKVELTHKEGSLEMALPGDFAGKAVEGEVYFYRPSDAGKDLRKAFRIQGNRHTLSLPAMQGMYDIKISWKSEGKTYFHEQKMFF